MTNSDETWTRYLFGELPEPEQARLEERYFTDAHTFEQLAQLETRLVDDYAQGRLPPQMRERFERAYCSSPSRRARLRFGEALAAKLHEIAATRDDEQAHARAASWWQRLASSLKGGQRALAFSLALLLLLFSSVSAWLFIRNERLRQELARARDTQAAQEQRERETRQQLAEARARMQELNAGPQSAEPNPHPTPSAPVSPTPHASAPAVASIVLVASSVRGVDTGAPPTLVIRKETQQVQLRLNLRENEYKSYRLILQAVGGREVFNRALKPRTTTAGPSFILSLPASKVGAGDYILTLKGVTSGGEVEDVSQSLFRVEEK